jgi:hypothetical protein
MKSIIAAAAAAGGMAAIFSSASARGILHDPVALNIGINCQWQERCMKLHRGAMKRALYFVRVKHPPQWRVQLCNRNASRGGYRVDWIGFDHCIRNSGFRRPSQARSGYAAR